jgi:hypothetical protein
VVVETPLGRLGLAICYDLRFPALFEALGQAKCDVIAIPAAFTVPTGAAHWHLMQRARAVEASAWVVSAAQVGHHEDGRATYGHSLVVDPWGDVVLDMGAKHPVWPLRRSIRRAPPPCAGNCPAWPTGARWRRHDRLRPAVRGRGHRFEGWFGSSDDFAGQQARGLLACPQCGSAQVVKAVMAPRLTRKGNQQQGNQQAPAVTPQPQVPFPPEAQAALLKLAEHQAEVLRSSRWVGDNFVRDARAMHYGDKQVEAIHGQATPRRRAN